MNIFQLEIGRVNEIFTKKNGSVQSKIVFGIVILRRLALVIPLLAEGLTLAHGAKPGREVEGSPGGGDGDLVVEEVQQILLVGLQGVGLLGGEAADQQLGTILLVKLKKK